MKRSYRIILIILLCVIPVSATYNAYDSATGTWRNTTLTNMLEYSTNELLINHKLTDYYGYYGFDATSGTVENYNTSTGLPLTLAGSATRSSTSWYGRSLSLDGTNGGYASPGYGYDWTSGNWTMSAWIKSVGYPVAGSTLGGRYSSGLGYKVMYSYTGTGAIYVFSNASSCNTPSGAVPSDSAWHHIVAMKSGTTCAIYVDGVSKSVSGTLNNTWTTAGASVRFEIGTSANDATPNFNGLIDEFKMWKRALTATEAQNLYNSTYSTYGNATSFYLAAPGNITNKITINWTTPTSTNYTAWYKNSTGGTFAQFGGTLTGNNTFEQAMFLNTTIEVRNAGRGNVTTKGLQITYYEGSTSNSAPVLASIGNQVSTTRSYLNLTLSATDVNGDNLTYATNDTKGTLDPVTGEYSVHYAKNENGTYWINFSVSDPYGGVDYEIISVTVSESLPFTLPAVYTNWWNTSYTYRASVNVADGVRPYQLRINVSNGTGTNSATNIFCNGHCNTNLTDIRFTLDNGTALPFWIENVSLGTVWVNLTANGSINMYYGNSTVTTSTSNGNTTFTVFDDQNETSFNMSKWSVSGTGTTTMSSGTLVIQPPLFIYSKAKYTPTSAGIGYFVRVRAKRGPTDTSGWGGVGFASSNTKGDDTKQSYPLDWWTAGGSYINCVNGKDGVSYYHSNYTTALDNNFHIGEFRRGGTNDTCILEDAQTKYATSYSTLGRYVAMEAYSITLTVDYIFMGNYALSASSWDAWGSEETGSAGTEYIPPTPVLASEENGADGEHWRKVTWSNGWGNVTDAYIVGLNDVYTVNTGLLFLNETLDPHEWMNVTIYALNYSNSTVNMTPLENNYQFPNHDPVLSPIGSKKVYQNKTLTFQMGVTDDDSDTITYGTNCTKGTLDTGTGAYSFSSVPADVGAYICYFNASDIYEGIANETITITVSAPKTISLQVYNIGWQILNVNDTQSMSSLNTLFSPTYISVWNSTPQAWIKYKSGWSFNQDYSVSRDQAAMMKFTTDTTLSFDITDTSNWTLNTGYNLIGIPENMTLSQINASVNSGLTCENVDEITYVYPANMTEVTYTCQNGVGQTNADVTVDAGRGVWMYALRAVDIKNVMG